MLITIEILFMNSYKYLQIVLYLNKIIYLFYYLIELLTMHENLKWKITWDRSIQ